MVQRRHPRGGFTTVELLVVISIIALLVSLTAAGVQRARQSAYTRATEGVVVETQSALEDQVRAIVSRARKERAAPQSAEFRALKTHCDEDEDRAEALLVYARVRQNFPQGFGEVGAFTVGGVSFEGLSTFRQYGTAPWTGAGASPELQSAVLLHAALMERSQGAGGIGLGEAATGSVTTVAVGANQAKVFKDGWGRAIGFYRFGQNNEMQAAPYTNAKSPDLRDPYDPLAKLKNWNPTPATKKTGCYAPVFGSGLAGGSAGSFDGLNKMPTTYSAGVNGSAEGLGGDDILGYRLRQLGAKGSK